MSMPLPDLRLAARQILALGDPCTKASATRALWEARERHALDTTARLTAPAGQPLPGRPQRPALVPPQQVPLRSAFTLAGRAALLHAIAHIEFNAINLALDAVWRFDDMPHDYYLEWLQVASEEALHFTLIHTHLASLGHAYGDFDAHSGLWDLAERTAHDLAARMALVPRIMEAALLAGHSLLTFLVKREWPSTSTARSDRESLSLRPSSRRGTRWRGVTGKVADQENGIDG